MEIVDWKIRKAKQVNNETIRIADETNTMN